MAGAGPAGVLPAGSGEDRGAFQPVLPPALPAAAVAQVPRGRSGLLLTGLFLAFFNLFLALFRSFWVAPGFRLRHRLYRLAHSLGDRAAYGALHRTAGSRSRCLLFAFVWGAVVSIAVTTSVSIFLRGGALGLDYYDVRRDRPGRWSRSLPSPWGCCCSLLFARKHFDGPVDGRAFAFTIAAGFAFTENILYFGRAIAESATRAPSAVVFFLRGVMSPFAHAIFTGTTRGRHPWASPLAAWHNGLRRWPSPSDWSPRRRRTAHWARTSWPRTCWCRCQILLLAVVVISRAARRLITREMTQADAAAGWFDTGRGGHAGHQQRPPLRPAWAKSLAAVTHALLHAATQLAFTRQRIQRLGRGGSPAR